MTEKYPVHKHMVELGEENRAKIREMFVTYPGITNREIASRLGMNAAVVGRHVKKIRQEWIK